MTSDSSGRCNPACRRYVPTHRQDRFCRCRRDRLTTGFVRGLSSRPVPIVRAVIFLSCAGAGSGYLQVDGYAGYEKNDTTLVGCWAHACRKFVEVQKAQVKGKTEKADWAINHIKKLYRIESEIKQKTALEKRLPGKIKAWFC